MKASAILLALLCACADDQSSEPLPPFTYRILNVESNGPVLLDLSFDNYPAALKAAGPYEVDVVEGGQQQRLAFSIGFCQPYPCTGPLELEQLVVSLNAAHEYVDGYQCKGVRGSIYGGLDVSRHGDCELQ